MAPHLFNITLDKLSVIFDKLVQKHKWGIPVRCGTKIVHICLILFADNYWIVATSPDELQTANNAWQSLLRQAGWSTPASDLRYGTTAADTDFQSEIRSEGRVIPRVPKKEGFKVLGTQLVFHNRFEAELDRRVKAAWAAFYKNAEVLCCKAAPLAKRLKFLALVAEPALFWCAGSWRLTCHQLIRIRGVQRSMVRKMCVFPKEVGEDVETYMRRTNAAITCLLAMHNVQPWDLVARQAVFRWAGWVARLRHFDPERLTLSILQHKNLQWLNTIASQNNGRQLHGRILRTWRWESPLQSFIEELHPGVHWVELAQDSDAWREIVSKVH